MQGTLHRKSAALFTAAYMSVSQQVDTMLLVPSRPQKHLLPQALQVPKGVLMVVINTLQYRKGTLTVQDL